MITADEIVQAAGLQDTFTPERISRGRAVWFYGPYVLRAHSGGGLDDETRLLRFLPASVPHAPVVASGEGWMVQRRIEGEPLDAVWTTLSEDKQRAAAQQLAAVLMNLHQVRLSGTPSLSPGWFPAILPADIIRMAEAQRDLHPRLMDKLIRFTQATMAQVTPPLRWGFIHRDLHLEHVLWNGDRISALLDFESAINAPRELELEALVRFCHAHSPDFEVLGAWLHEDYPLLFNEAGSERRLFLYSIEHDLRLLADDPTALDRLRALVEG
jgi:aminoglycoside phosphotransferase (APT) family kinase protein